MDKEHLDRMLLNELGWKLDREVWAHVPGGGQVEEWTTSKAREESKKLIANYIGDYDKLNYQMKELKRFLEWNIQSIKSSVRTSSSQLTLEIFEIILQKIN